MPTPFRTQNKRLILDPIKKVVGREVVQLAPRTQIDTLKRKGQRVLAAIRRNTAKKNAKNSAQATVKK